MPRQTAARQKNRRKKIPHSAKFHKIIFADHCGGGIGDRARSGGGGGDEPGAAPVWATLIGFVAFFASIGRKTLYGGGYFEGLWLLDFRCQHRWFRTIRFRPRAVL